MVIAWLLFDIVFAQILHYVQNLRRNEVNMDKNKELYELDQGLISDVMKLRFYPINVERAMGSKMYDAEGNEYIDMNAGWAVMNLGYGNREVINAIESTLERVTFTPLISTISKEAITLSEWLIRLMPGDFDKKVWYGHSGSDANEFLAKMLPLATGKKKIVTFIGSYHGQTMGSYEMSGHPALREFQPKDSHVIKAQYPHCYHCPAGCQAEDCHLECMELCKKTILDSAGSYEDISAVVIEAAQSDGGDVPAPFAFIKALETFCHEHGIYLIFDEVKIGIGRTGKWFGFMHSDVVPDAVVIGKPLGEGQPLSAVVGRKELMDAGVGLHLFTTSGNPVACAAALATLKYIEEQHVMEHVNEVSTYLAEGFRKLQNKYAVIGDVRNLGFLMGVELVEANSKAPATKLCSLVMYRSYELGMLCYCTGIDSNVLEFTPPLILTREEADRVVDILDRAIDDALNGRVDETAVAKFGGWA